MSRKSVSFAQLYDYINRGHGMGDEVAWNMPHYADRERMLQQFYHNAALLRKNIRGNALYHEIISLKYRHDVSLDRQMKALYDITHKYLDARGKHLLGYGRMHLERGHIHIHLMLSSNEMHQQKRHRLSKAEFAQIQKQCEQYLQQTYPDLRQPTLYGKGMDRRPNRSKQREYEKPEQTKKPDRKEQVRDRLLKLLTANHLKGLHVFLKEHGFELYQRGETYGVIFEGKKYRIKTLGLEKELDNALANSSPSKSQNRPTPKSHTRAYYEQKLDDLEKYYRQVDHDLENTEPER